MMELKLDPSKVYAIALEGGGARGGYQVGAWRALREAGIRYNAVSGTSVGALNGAMMAMNELEEAESLWRDISFSQVMDVDDEMMGRILNFDFRSFGEFKSALHSLHEVIQNGGLDIEPLRNLLAQHVDAEKIHNSGIAFYLTTFSLTDRKELELDASVLDEGELRDMLLASAYFPAFKQEKISGKHYADGGLQDVVPISSLISRGYKDLIVLRLYGPGLEKRVKIPEDVTVTTIAPEESLGNVLNFSSEQSSANMVLGFYDAQRVLYGLFGKTYYLERTLTEPEAYEILCNLVRPLVPDATLRELHEDFIPELGSLLRCRGDYYDLLIAAMERVGEEIGLTPFRIRTDRIFLEEIRENCPQPTRRSDRILRYFASHEFPLEKT